MPKKNSYLTVTDQFCGAGGSSQGVRALSQEMGGGLELKLALNHWALAIETHNTNFPDAIHDCTDISAADPRRYPSTDILITSPECTNHSPGSGKKVLKKQMDLFSQGKLDASAERSRATMWDVVRFAEFHKYNAIIVENVVEARNWIPFDAWLQAMAALGYLHKCVYLNSMHCHPTPQSRDRMYIVFWKKANKAPDLEYYPPAHCHRCDKDILSIQTWKRKGERYGKYRKQYVYCCPICAAVVEPYYYASFNAIDWSDIGVRIGDRPKPLCKNTIIRGKHGLNKYGSEPFQMLNYTPGYSKSLRQTLGTITTQDHHGLFFPPFIIKLEHSQSKVQNKVTQYVKSAYDALFTQTTCQGSAFITPPIITISRGKSKSTSAFGPLNTISAGGIHSGIITSGSWNSFLASNYNGSNCMKHISQEMGSLSTKDPHALYSFKTPDFEDCYYRMLKPPEVQRGMAFSDDYIILGNGRDKVKQCGNAVTPPAMKWLAGQVLKSLN